MENRETTYVRILKEICREEGITLRAYSSYWAFQFTRGKQKAFVLGYQFGLNLSSVEQICKDKNITSEILKDNGVPSVYHACFMSPRLISWTGASGNWRDLLAFLDREKTIVCKDNTGTGGNTVYLVRNDIELERACAEIFKTADSMAVCACENILDECRLVILDGVIRLAFHKIRPFVTGDGVRTLGALLGERIAEGEGYGSELPDKKTLSRVPAAGETVVLNWKHNLGQGASALEEDPELLPAEMKALAAKTIDALHIRFASIDVIKTPEGYKVLEVNSGVMMEHFASESETNYRKAKAIYRDAILTMLAESADNT